jgi:hypothetical protein
MYSRTIAATLASSKLTKPTPHDGFGQLWKRLLLTLRRWRPWRPWRGHFIDPKSQLRIEIVRVNLLDGRRRHIWFFGDIEISFLFRKVVQWNLVPLYSWILLNNMSALLETTSLLALAAYTPNQYPLKKRKRRKKRSFENQSRKMVYRRLHCPETRHSRHASVSSSKMRCQ